jgi:hypothetical protein
MHVPALQTCPTGQAVPHAPQLFGSLCVFAHVRLAPQRICPVEHGATHIPLTHVRSAAQTVPHAPQLLLSLFVSVQTEPHWRLGGAHALASVPTRGRQYPPRHAYPVPHAPPQ